VGEHIEVTTKQPDKKDERKKNVGKVGKQLNRFEKANEKVEKPKKSEEKVYKLKSSIKRVANTKRMVTCKKAKLIDLPAKGDEVNKMPVEVENTVLKDQDAYLFEFPTNHTPMQKLN
jgi:hypothetical protein